MSRTIEVNRITRPVWIGGFNLLPYRQRDARLARKRRVVEWLVAALCGCVAVAAVIGWQALNRARVDAMRETAERTLAGMSSPLAEHVRLVREASDERQQNMRATALSEPLVHLLDLLDAMSRDPIEEVVVRQLRHREHETELLAVSTDHAAAAAWLNRLGTVRGVRDAGLSDLHPATKGASGQSGAVEMTAHVKWGGAPDKNGASRSLHDNTKGAK